MVFKMIQSQLFTLIFNILKIQLFNLIFNFRESQLTLYWKIAAQGRQFNFYDFELTRLETILIHDKFKAFLKV